MAEKWEKVEIKLTEDERRSFRSALIIFVIVEALVLVPFVLSKVFR